MLYYQKNQNIYSDSFLTIYFEKNENFYLCAFYFFLYFEKLKIYFFLHTFCFSYTDKIQKTIIKLSQKYLLRDNDSINVYIFKN